MSLSIIEKIFRSEINGRSAGEYARPVGWHGIFDGAYFHAFDVDQFVRVVMEGVEYAVGAPGPDLDRAEAGIRDHTDILIQRQRSAEAACAEAAVFAQGGGHGLYADRVGKYEPAMRLEHAVHFAQCKPQVVQIG